MYWQPAQIIGEERSTSGSAGFDVINPATEETLCTCPEAGEAEALAALQAARTGFDAWRSETPWRRAQALRRIATLLAERADDIAETMTREVGKPLAESRAELAAAIEAFDWNADETRRIYDRSMTGRAPEARVEVRQEPVGIVLALTAWNFPIGLAGGSCRWPWPRDVP